MNAQGYKVAYHELNKEYTTKKITVKDCELDLRTLNLKRNQTYVFNIKAFGRNWELDVASGIMVYIRDKEIGK